MELGRRHRAASTWSACATSHRPRRTTRSAAAGQAAAGSPPWCSPTARPAARTTSTSSAARPDGRRGGEAAAPRPGQRGPGPGPRPRALARPRPSLNLGKSLETVLDLQSEKLPIRAHVRAKLEDAAARARALNRAIECLGAVVHDHIDSDAGGWFEEVLDEVPNGLRPSVRQVAGPLQLRHRPVRSAAGHRYRSHAEPQRPQPGPPPSGRGRDPARAAHPGGRGAVLRLQQLPLLRQRGLPPWLQLPPPPTLGVPPGRAGRQGPGRVPAAGRGSWRSPSSGRAPSSTTRGRGTGSTRSSFRSHAPMTPSP